LRSPRPGTGAWARTSARRISWATRAARSRFRPVGGLTPADGGAVSDTVVAQVMVVQVRWRGHGTAEERPMAQPMNLPPKSLVTKRDQIVDALRRRILSGALARGERMPQDELARQFGASITPVREALRQLEAEGLVVAEAHRGVRVAGVDLEQVKAVYVTRRLTEGYAMRRATQRLSRRDLAQARALLVGGDAHGDPVLARERNRAFHFLFYERCGMPALADRIAGMWQAFPWDLMLDSADRAEASQREHLAILDELERGDPDRVAAATELHLRNGFGAILRHLTGSDGPDPFDPDID
jgi:DNA-binding GntR family transcriptional regulator